MFFNIRIFSWMGEIKAISHRTERFVLSHNGRRTADVAIAYGYYPFFHIPSENFSYTLIICKNFPNMS